MASAASLVSAHHSSAHMGGEQYGRGSASSWSASARAWSGASSGHPWSRDPASRNAPTQYTESTGRKKQRKGKPKRFMVSCNVCPVGLSAVDAFRKGGRVEKCIYCRSPFDYSGVPEDAPSPPASPRTSHGGSVGGSAPVSPRGKDELGDDIANELASLRLLADKGYDVADAISKAESKLIIPQPAAPPKQQSLSQTAREQSDAVQLAIRNLEKAELFLQNARNNTVKLREKLAEAEADEQRAVVAVSGARQSVDEAKVAATALALAPDSARDDIGNAISGALGGALGAIQAMSSSVGALQSLSDPLAETALGEEMGGHTVKKLKGQHGEGKTTLEKDAGRAQQDEMEDADASGEERGPRSGDCRSAFDTAVGELAKKLPLLQEALRSLASVVGAIPASNGASVRPSPVAAVAANGPPAASAGVGKSQG